MRPAVLTIFLFCLLPSSLHAGGGETIEGPVTAHVLRIIDGDTLLVRATPWPQYAIETYVRLRGIDAPEMKSGCASERRAAHDARRRLARLTPTQTEVTLSRISGDKYFGRILADVVTANGVDPAQDLLEAGLVKTYAGGKRQKRACRD